ncbi:hypothetical protein F183_A51350 [Bryobacterales bacterium F-183]|nr:hypothetical protein F183_A51350 [Bryobacterales bacterium F-183]
MPNHKKSVDVSFTVPGTPEQIWDAIATGPGISAWFTPTTLDPREGGAITFHLGPEMDSKGTITAWDPPRLFAYEERDWSGDAPPLATEFRIEAQPGGEPCKVRIVHSLFTDRDDWDDQLASMEGGWGAMFGVLDLYLRDFAGAPGVCIRPTVPFAGDLEAGWRKLDAAVERDYASSVVRRSSGSKNREALLRLVRDEGTVALISAYDWGGKISLVACVYFYGQGGAAAAERAEPHWQAWLQAAAATGN